MKFLLDSDVVIYHLRSKQYLSKTMMDSGVCISIITYGELLYGIEKSTRKENATILSRFLKYTQVKILPVDEAIMKMFAQTKANLEKAGNRIPDFDLLIGCTAKVMNLSLHTNNKKHFARIPGLKIV